MNVRDPVLRSPPERVYRCFRGVDPLVFTSWEYVRRGSRGRWDDMGEEYRVLYFSSSEVGAYVESLQDLRQSVSAASMLSEIDGPDEAPLSMIAVIQERLKNRRIASLIPGNPDERVVDVSHGQSRTYFETSLALPGPIKIGDFTKTDRTLSRAVSRMLYDLDYLGLLAPSAEHASSSTIAVFETHSVSGKARLFLIPSSIDLALARSTVIEDAASYLGLGESSRT